MNQQYLIVTSEECRGLQWHHTTDDLQTAIEQADQMYENLPREEIIMVIPIVYQRQKL